MTNFKNNLSCICTNAFSKELIDSHNNPVLSEKERIDQMVNKISSVLNCAALKEQRDSSKKKRIKRKRKQVWYDNECTNKYKHLKFLSRQLAKNSWDLLFYSICCFIQFYSEVWSLSRWLAR